MSEKISDTASAQAAAAAEQASAAATATEQAGAAAVTQTDTAQNGLALISSAAGGLAAFNDKKKGGLGLPKPFTNRILLLEHLHVAGTTHIQGINDICENLAPGTELELKRDVGNAHDKWAVKVYAPDGRRMGFLPCDKNEVIARLMDGGKRCFAVVKGTEQRGKWSKIDIEVYLDD